MTSAEIVLVLTNSYEFETTDNETSALISQYTSIVAPVNGTTKTSTYKYTYDANGNITEIKNASDVIQYKYTYDNKGQLIREDNRPLNRTFLYSYDDAGNILTSVSYVLSLDVEDFSALNKLTNHRFNYDANGRLSEYVGKGSFTYDGIGNPIKYRGRTLTWKNGRQLATFTRSGVTYEFDYNADGIRTYKAGGGLTTEYVLNGSQVMRQIISDGTTTYVADYIYHENGSPLAFAYYQQGSAPVYYFYDLNLQGDIIGIYDENGAKVVGFRYDAWGNFNTDKSNTTVCTDLFLRASLFRYRSYIYDYETDLYYLQSRYYDYEIGRFINADKIGVLTATPTQLTDKNFYAYCDNNPIMRVDGEGDFWHVAIGAAVGAISGLVSLGISSVFDGTAPSLAEIGIAVGVGALSGVISSCGIPFGYALVANTILSIGESVAMDVVGNVQETDPSKKSTTSDIIRNATVSACFSLAFGYIGGSSNGKEMNKMYKNAKDAMTTLGTKGVSPNLKPALKNTIGEYYTALGRNIGEGIGEIALSPVTAFVSESASKFAEFITTGRVK